MKGASELKAPRAHSYATVPAGLSFTHIKHVNVGQRCTLYTAVEIMVLILESKC